MPDPPEALVVEVPVSDEVVAVLAGLVAPRLLWVVLDPDDPHAEDRTIAAPAATSALTLRFARERTLALSTLSMPKPPD